VTSAASADRLIWPSIGCGACRFPPILRRVIGEEFASVLACAQRGDEAAFARLWLDVNPALVRYSGSSQARWTRMSRLRRG
jgi:hypothetical protein